MAIGGTTVFGACERDKQQWMKTEVPDLCLSVSYMDFCT